MQSPETLFGKNAAHDASSIVPASVAQASGTTTGVVFAGALGVASGGDAWQASVQRTEAIERSSRTQPSVDRPQGPERLRRPPVSNRPIRPVLRNGFIQPQSLPCRALRLPKISNNISRLYQALSARCLLHGP